MNDPLDQFAPLLDPEHMAVALQQHLPECATGEWHISDCDIQHPRYKTYLSPENRERSFLSLVYHLRGRLPSSPALENRILYARAYLGDRSLREFEAARSVLRQDSMSAVLHLSGLGVVGWRFPDDPAMPWLAQLMRAENAATLIPLDDTLRLEGCDELEGIEIVNYRPEIRCTARYRFRSTDTPKQSVVYGKTYADESGREIYENSQELRRQSRLPHAFAIPRALGYDPGHHTLWLEGLQGKPLKEALFQDGCEALVDGLCKGLSAFDEVSLPHLEAITPEQHLQEWRKKAQKLAHAYAECGDLLQSLLADLQQSCPEPEESRLIHGDFHIDQLALLGDGRLALFDFDELALGDPLQDLANFAADLNSYAMPVADIDRLLEQLFAAYRRASVRRVDANRFVWHLRGQLLTRAYRTHIQQKTDAKQRVAQLIALARRHWPYAD